MTREDIIKLPKVELHCHLDGSLSREFVEKRLGRQVGKEELSVSNDCTSLAEYLEKFDLPDCERHPNLVGVLEQIFKL